MELVLVRHGEPRWVVDSRNRNDPELTERGRLQAERVAARLADVDDDPLDGPADHLLVSPALRARETAAPIAEALGIEASVHDWLLELGVPDAWDGGAIEDIEAAFARQQGLPREEWWEGLPGAEPIPEFHERVGTGIDAALARMGLLRTGDPALWQIAPSAPERVVVVSHAGTSSTLVAHLLGVEKEPWDWERFHMGHASVAVLRTRALAGAHVWSLRALGDAAHIDRADRTA